MANINNKGYYRKPRDHAMWGEFDLLAHRLRTNTSSLLAEAAREYLERHKGERAPEPPLPPDKRRGLIIDYDPFETMKDAPVAPPRVDPFKAAEKERDNT